jgi:hypothetical protein
LRVLLGNAFQQTDEHGVVVVGIHSSIVSQNLARLMAPTGAGA